MIENSKRKRLIMKHSKTQNICMTGVVTALICILAPLAVPTPLGIPITLQSFVISLAGILLGPGNGALAVLLYLLLGAMGLPVFSQFTGGFQCLVGPTGGFLLSFPLMALICGIGIRYHRKKRTVFPLSLLLANLLNLLIGTGMYCMLMQVPFPAGLSACVFPFIPATVIKIALTWFLGIKIKRRLTIS